MTRFLAGLEARTLASLVKIGLLAPDRVAVAKPLSAHLDDFAAALRAKGNGTRHVELLTARARKLLVHGCRFRFYGDISASKVMAHLHERRADTDKKRGMSAQTFNSICKPSSNSAAGPSRTAAPCKTRWPTWMA